jgi:hypothetical protein
MNAQTEFPATDRQREYLHDLINQQDLTASIKWMDATQGMDAEELEAAFGELHERVDGRLGKREAAIRYGKELGRCGICNRTLTNNDSIALGIGPVCAEKVGW